MVILDLIMLKDNIFVPIMIRGNKGCGCLGKKEKETPASAALAGTDRNN